jgi:hypothetical protein
MGRISEVETLGKRFEFDPDWSGLGFFAPADFGAERLGSSATRRPGSSPLGLNLCHRMDIHLCSALEPCIIDSLHRYCAQMLSSSIMMISSQSQYQVPWTWATEWLQPSKFGTKVSSV